MHLHLHFVHIYIYECIFSSRALLFGRFEYEHSCGLRGGVNRSGNLLVPQHVHPSRRHNPRNLALSGGGGGVREVWGRREERGRKIEGRGWCRRVGRCRKERRGGKGRRRGEGGRVGWKLTVIRKPPKVHRGESP